MNHLLSYLEDIGLNKTEATLYIAGITYSRPVGVHELQKQTGMKRPTIYHNLNQLMARGLVSKSIAQQRTLFSFSPPDQLERMVQQEIRESKAKLRTVALLAKEFGKLEINAGDTTVRHYEGIEGIKRVVDVALYCRKPIWYVIAPQENFFSQFDKEYARYYNVTRKRHEIMSKTLWEAPKNDGRLLSNEEIAERNPRFLPEIMKDRFKATTILFDNKIALVTSMEERSAILIESTELSDLYKAMFDGLWEMSTPYTEAISSASLT